MSLKLPVFAYNVAYNLETTKNMAKYFDNIESLKNIITKTEKEELNNISDHLLKIAVEHYLWSNISQKYYDHF